MRGREVKFRAWHKIRKEMFRVTNINFDLETQEASFVFVAGYPYPTPMRDMEVMQFTGLLDKNGKEIYEGDVVATGFGADYTKGIVRIGMWEMSVETYETSYTLPYYGVYLDRAVGLEEFLLTGQMYVLGNEYENPELLGA